MHSNWRMLLGSIIKSRTVAAFVLAPVSPALILVLIATPFGSSNAGEALWLLKLSALLGYPIAVVLGIPFYAFLRSRGWNSLGVYVFLGAVMGLVLYFFYIPPFEISPAGLLRLSTTFMNTSPVFASLGVICGIVATIVFWLIARPGRL